MGWITLRTPEPLEIEAAERVLEAMSIGRAANTARAMLADLVAVGHALPLFARGTAVNVVASVAAMDRSDRQGLLASYEGRTNDRPAVQRRRRWSWRCMLTALDEIEAEAA